MIIVFYGGTNEINKYYLVVFNLRDYFYYNLFVFLFFKCLGKDEFNIS